MERSNYDTKRGEAEQKLHDISIKQKILLYSELRSVIKNRPAGELSEKSRDLVRLTRLELAQP